MKLDWNDMEEVSLPHFYGGEKTLRQRRILISSTGFTLPHWNGATAITAPRGIRTAWKTMVQRIWYSIPWCRSNKSMFVIVAQ